METLLQKYVINGGIMMVPLIFCSLLMLGGVLQGMIRLRRGRVAPDSILRRARGIHNAATLRPFVMELRRHSSPLGRAIWFALKDCLSQDRAPHLREVDALVEEGTQLATDEMYDGLGMLGTIYTIAPLLGLMGTILGMMQAFYEFGVRNEKSIELLSVGIQEALVTTLWGLAIAVLAFMATQWFQGKIRRYERFDLPQAAREVIVMLYGPTPEAANEPERTPDFLSNQPAAEGETAL